MFKKNIKIIFTILGIFLMIWFGFSYFEIIFQNINLAPTKLSNWNLFQMFF